MNFYIGNSIDEINEQDVNVEFCDELIDFIYKMSGQVSFDMSKLYQIDPYDDVEVSKNDLFQVHARYRISVLFLPPLFSCSVLPLTKD